jgi:hypothetical protein
MIIRDHMPRSLQELLNKVNFHGSKSAAQAATWSYMVGTAIASESLIPPHGPRMRPKTRGDRLGGLT